MTSLNPIENQNSQNENGISLVIPRVFNNIGFRRIKSVFIRLGWGFVERVDVIPSGTHKRAFVHFAPGKWNTGSVEAMAVLDALRSGQQVQVVYDEPWFWKVSISQAGHPEEARSSLRTYGSLPSTDSNENEVRETPARPLSTGSNENKVHEHNFNLCECGAVKPLERIHRHGGYKKNKTYKRRKKKKTKCKSKQKRKKSRKNKVIN